jgi:hypothetical protein
VPWDPGGYTCAGVQRVKDVHVHVQELGVKIKSLGSFKITNNHISRNVKGLFVGISFASSRVILKMPMLQLEDELLEKGWGNVRSLMGRLGRPIMVRSRDRIRSFLRVK